jgi:hypothetical protein
MDMMFGPSVIGSDILDIGTRKADTRARRQDGALGLPPDMMIGCGAPGQFDLPNVPDVSDTKALRGIAYGHGVYKLDGGLAELIPMATDFCILRPCHFPILLLCL